jgi:hypothetical protein
LINFALLQGIGVIVGVAVSGTSVFVGVSSRIKLGVEPGTTGSEDSGEREVAGPAAIVLATDVLIRAVFWADDGSQPGILHAVIPNTREKIRRVNKSLFCILSLS